MRGFGLPLLNSHLGVWVALRSPSQTAISGYAGLLRSLRSNVVGPHTHSCRFLCEVGYQVIGAQKCLRLPNWVGMHQSPSHPCVAAPMVGASPDNIGAKRLAEGGVPAGGAGFRKSSGGQMGRHPKSAQKNWNLTPIKSTPFAHLSDQVIGHSQG